MGENWKVEHDNRQYALMLEHLQSFEKGAIDLGSLIRGLDALFRVLEKHNEPWDYEFRHQWEKLEEVYAVALDLHEQGLAPDLAKTLNEPKNQALIKSAIEKIKALLADRAPAEADDP
jgi:hypothetical protein